MALFQKLGVEIEFLIFRDLVNQYMIQWTGKDCNFIGRAGFWLSEFNDKPVKSVLVNQNWML